MIETKLIRAFIEELEHNESQLKVEVMEQVPSSLMVPALYKHVIGGLKGMINDAES